MELYSTPRFLPRLPAIYPGPFHPFVVVTSLRRSQPPLLLHIYIPLSAQMIMPCFGRGLSGRINSVCGQAPNRGCVQKLLQRAELNPQSSSLLFPSARFLFSSSTGGLHTLYTRVHGYLTSASHALSHPPLFPYSSWCHPHAKPHLGPPPPSNHIFSYPTLYDCCPIL